MKENVTKIDIERFLIKAVDIWNESWFLLTCGNYFQKQFNCMTVSWGSFGNMWNLPFALVVVRPSRYTYEFINAHESFTLSAFSEEYKDALNLLGSRSGRDGDKIKQSGLTVGPSILVDAPYFLEAELVVECKKIYWDDYKPENFLNPVINGHYPSGDYHRMFFGEILNVRGDEKKYVYP